MMGLYKACKMLRSPNPPGLVAGTTSATRTVPVISVKCATRALLPKEPSEAAAPPLDARRRRGPGFRVLHFVGG